VSRYSRQSGSPGRVGARLKSAAATAALVLASTAFGLVLAELGLRLFGDFRIVPQMFVTDENVGYRLESNVREVTERPGVYRYAWTTNAQGFRGERAYAVPKPAGGRRVLMIGDSFTFGMGVDDDEIAAVRLEGALREVCGDPGIEVVNTGVPSYGTSQELATLERYGLPLQPDVVVLSVVSNDADDNLATGLHELVGDSLREREVTAGPGSGVYRWKRIANATPGYRFLSRHSVLVGVLRQLGSQAARSRSLADGAGEPSEADSAARRVLALPDTSPAALRAAALDPSSYRYRLMQRLMGRMKSVSEGAGAEFLVAVIPDSWELRGYAAGRPEEAPLMTAGLRMCDSVGAGCVNVGEHLIRESRGAGTDQFYFGGDAHFNGRGQAAMAAALVQPVARRLGCGSGPGVADSPPSAQRLGQSNGVTR
jgi:hypothetical protein